jgi:RNase P/RNase MRP subunit p29
MVRARAPPAGEVPPDEVEAWMGEILGASVTITKAPGLRPLPLDGVLVDESLHLFVVRPAGRARLLRVPKAGVEGTILLGGRQLPLSGDALRMRPEDRTKRISPRARRRNPR